MPIAIETALLRRGSAKALGEMHIRAKLEMCSAMAKYKADE